MNIKHLKSNAQHLASSILKHPLITGSSIIFVGTFIGNIFNYIFNLAMGRMLPVSDYGLLTSLSSIFVMLGIFNIAFIKIFAKFSAEYATNNNVSGTINLINTGVKKIVISAAIMLIVLLALTVPIANFLHINNYIYAIIIFVAIFFSIMETIPIGILQGHMRFYSVSGIRALQSLIKLLFAVALVYFGFQLLGATVAILISSIATVFIGYVFLYKYFYKKNQSNNTGEVSESFERQFKHYSYTFILTAIGITLLQNTDIILVRHLFDETVSGQYAALSLMGKAIFYITMPINFAFFPLIVQKKEKKERLFRTVILTTGIIMAGSLLLSFIYFVFPGVILNIFFPSPEYEMLKPFLGIFSLYILMFSLVYLANSFFLSIGKTGIYKLTLAAGILQIVLIYNFHASLYQVIGVLFLVNFLLFVSFLLYYMRHGKD